MANIHRGEVTVSLNGRAYTLRPSFHILCQMEERIGLTLPQLLRRVAGKGLLASEVLMILAIATRHDGSAAFDSASVMDLPAAQVKLDAVMPAIARFLVQALGGGRLRSTAPATSGSVPQDALDYAALLELSYKVLRLEPQAFWQLTMPELQVLLRAAHGQKPAVPAADELRSLMRRFPDAA
jgi:uncharacterized phage protein (TIGR02216 family)